MVRFHFVGAGTPTPSAKRFGTCYIIESGDDVLMFDCGPAATYKMTQMGLSPTGVDHLFFSHHHFDHNVDYPCFLLTRWDQAAGKVDDLKVYGPWPTALVTERLIGKDGAFFPDWQARVEHPGSQEIFEKRGGHLPRRPPVADVREIDSGAEVSGDRWSVTCTRVKHIEPLMPTLAYRFQCEGLSLVISSDTGLCQSIVNLAAGADYLVVHCWDIQEKMRPAEAGMIAGTLQAAEIAQKAGVRHLILSHFSPLLDFPGNRQKAIDDVAGLFDGDVAFAEELSTLRIE
jgi:ribonuclease BN (tRNA processing enzyme)